MSLSEIYLHFMELEKFGDDIPENNGKKDYYRYDIDKVKKYFEETSIAPEDINSLLESKNSSPLSQKVKLISIIGRPHIGLDEIIESVPFIQNDLQKYDRASLGLAEVSMKYRGYIAKEEEMVEKMNRLENVKLNKDFDYSQLVSLSSEAREKLSRIKPMTIGQASRISGVSPSDVSVLLVHVGR